MPMVSVDLSYGQEIKIRKNAKTNYFMAVGKMVNDKGFNFVDVMSKLNPVAYRVFWEMVKVRDVDTNMVILDSSQHTSSQNSIISKGYKVLKEKELVIKVGKGSYLLNPHAILPTFEKVEEVNKEWSRACAKSEVKKRE